MIRARGSYPGRQDQPIAAPRPPAGALLPRDVCLDRTSAVKATEGLAAAAGGADPYSRLVAQVVVAAQEAFGWVVVDAALVRCLRTGLNLPCHLALLFPALCHPGACLAPLDAPAPRTCAR